MWLNSYIEEKKADTFKKTSEKTHTLTEGRPNSIEKDDGKDISKKKNH